MTLLPFVMGHMSLFKQTIYVVENVIGSNIGRLLNFCSFVNPFAITKTICFLSVLIFLQLKIEFFCLSIYRNKMDYERVASYEFFMISPGNNWNTVDIFYLDQIQVDIFLKPQSIFHWRLQLSPHLQYICMGLRILPKLNCLERKILSMSSMSETSHWSTGNSEDIVL